VQRPNERERKDISSSREHIARAPMVQISI